MSASQEQDVRRTSPEGQNGVAREHLVQFYESDAVLVESVGGFLEASLAARAAAVVIATPEHLEAFERYARARGIDIDERRVSGQYVTLDAAATLAQLLVGEAPDRRRFSEVIEPVITAAASRHGRVAAFGEMVALLWRQGHHAAAVQLENLWNELAHRHHFSLLCAYPMLTARDVPAEWLGRVCAVHARTLAVEGADALPGGVAEAADLVSLRHESNGDVGRLAALEQALAGQASRFARFLDEAPIAIHSVDAEGRIVWANRAELELLGYAREEYVGRPIRDFHVDPARADSFLRRLMAGETLRNEPALLRSKDGRVRRVLLDSNSTAAADGSAHTRCFTRELGSAEDNQGVQARLAAIVECSDDAIVSKSLDGIILSWNPAAARMFGYSADELVGQPITRIIPPELHAEERKILDRLRAGERLDHYETTRVAKDGRRVEVSLTVSPLRDVNGNIVGASKVARDITDRKLFEKRLLEADRRKDEFLAMLGHELRNPLAPIRNVSEVLRRSATSDPTQENCCRILDRQVQHMTRLLDDLLDMSRIRQGKIQLQREPVEVLTVVARAVETSRPLIDARRHELSVALPPEPIRVFGDVTRLVQMLGNLLNNAAKYTPDGGRIEVTARRSGELVELAVKDSGSGIPADMLPVVFDLFVQVEQTMDRSQGGLGIGLSLVRTIAELHGGTATASSAGPGQGSEFVVRLPLLKAAAVARRPEDPASGGGRGAKATRRVLIVDDNTDAAETLAVLLRMGGHEAQTARSGQAGIDAVGSFQPHLVLLDIGLPDLDGYAVARRLRQAGFVATLAALTGYGQPGDRERAREAGFDHHFVKPIDPRALDRLLA